MSLSTASGYPQYAGTFVPEIWSPKLVTKFYDSTVFGEIANTDYEGEITSHGDKVHIRTVPSITVNDYQKGQDLTYEEPESGNVELHIDHGKYFGFRLDDVDKVQSDLDLLDDWATDASEQIKTEIDSDILGDIYTDVASENSGTSAGRVSGAFDLGASGDPVVLDSTNILDTIVNIGTVMDEQNIPETNRWIVLPPWACGLIKKSDLKDASLSGDGVSIVRNGRIGMIDRFYIYMSNLVDSVTDGTTGNTAYHILAGHKSGLTFASQMTEMETIRSEKRFGNLVRGLNVFGYEVIKPNALVHLYAERG